MKSHLAQTDADLMPFVPAPCHSSEIGGVVGIAPVMEDYELYGPFSNATRVNTANYQRSLYPITQKVTHQNNTWHTNYLWPSAAHALQAQKLLALHTHFASNNETTQTQAHCVIHMLNKLQALENATNNFTYLVSEHLSQLGFAHLKAFEDACIMTTVRPNDELGRVYLKTVLALKFAQYPELKNAAMQLAKRGILPIDLSQTDNHDNRLGIMILEFGNQFLSESGDTPKITNPENAFNLLATKQPNFVGYNNLAKYSPEYHIRMQMFKAELLEHAPELVSLNAAQSALRAIHRLFPSATNILVHRDKLERGNFVLNIIFEKNRDAQAFAEFAGKARNMGLAVTLGAIRAKRVFTELAEPAIDLIQPEDRFSDILREVQPSREAPMPIESPAPLTKSNAVNLQKNLHKTWGDLQPFAKVALLALILLTFPISLPIALGVHYSQQKTKLKAAQKLLDDPLGGSWKQPSSSQFQASHVVLNDIVPPSRVDPEANPLSSVVRTG